MNWSSEWNSGVPPMWPEIKPLIDNIPDSYNAITLSIITNEGDFPIQVQAIQVGDLAVHEHIKSDKKGSWQVTHVPTNTRFNAVPDGLHTKAALIEWCKLIQGELQDDWKQLASLTNETYSSKISAKDRVKELCLGTAVKASL